MQDQIYTNFVNNFSNTLLNLTSNQTFSEIIFLCIGTDRLTGDSFGPLVGYKLNALFKCVENTEVIGDLENTVSARNINAVVENIKNTYENPFIIAIDSALSQEGNTGDIVVSDKGVYLSAGINRNVAYVGNMSIKGVVGRNLKNANCNLRMLQTIPLRVVMNMADIVSKGIYNVVEIV